MMESTSTVGAAGDVGVVGLEVEGRLAFPGIMTPLLVVVGITTARLMFFRVLVGRFKN